MAIWLNREGGRSRYREQTAFSRPGSECDSAANSESESTRNLGSTRGKAVLDPCQDVVVALATSAAVRDTHYKWASSTPRRRGAPDPAYLTATQKIWKARHLNEALAWLEPRELLHVAGSRTVAEQLAQLPRSAGDAPDAAALWRPPDAEPLRAREPIRSPAA